MRHHVSVHPDYSDLMEWTGREKADIMYTDSSGTLTNALIEHGYLDVHTWNGRRPIYNIEVKTTPGSCEHPFFMGKNQYERVSDMETLCYRYSAPTNGCRCTSCHKSPRATESMCQYT
jgi:hypothetical protein